MNERTNLLVDYFGKFISGEDAESHLRSSESLISNEKMCEAALAERSKLNFLKTYVDYLETKKQPQFARLIKAFEVISEYFKKATEKCEEVIDKERCKKVIVSNFLSFKIQL